MEKTIEERAYEAVGHPKPPKGAMHVPEMLKFEERIFLNGYIKGAKEQKDIDIEKTCEFLEQNWQKYFISRYEMKVVKGFIRKIMEE